MNEQTPRPKSPEKLYNATRVPLKKTAGAREYEKGSSHYNLCFSYSRMRIKNRYKSYFSWLILMFSNNVAKRRKLAILQTTFCNKFNRFQLPDNVNSTNTRASPKWNLMSKHKNAMNSTPFSSLFQPCPKQKKLLCSAAKMAKERKQYNPLQQRQIRPELPEGFSPVSRETDTWDCNLYLINRPLITLLIHDTDLGPFIPRIGGFRQIR